VEDLVVLVADKNMQFALRGALNRPAALAIRAVKVEFRTHMGRDGGMRTSGVELLARDRSRFDRALLVFDYEGSGAAPGRSVEELEAALDRQLSVTWGSDAKAIVIEPELDVWLWGADNALREALTWPLQESIRDWLSKRGFAFDNMGKPLRPKEAFEALVVVHKLPRSSALYEKIASRISLQRCSDPAFLRLRKALQGWFGRPAA
jgi:hypothetical protein